MHPFATLQRVIDQDQGDETSFAALVEAARERALAIDAGEDTLVSFMHTLARQRRLGSLPDASIDHPANLWRLCDQVRDLAAACPSSAWCLALFSAHIPLLCELPEDIDVKRGLLDLDRDPLITTALYRDHGLVREGARVSVHGVWDFVTAARFADGMLIGLHDQNHKKGWLLVHPHEVEVLEAKRPPMGMRGTETVSIRLRDASFPSHRFVELRQLRRGPRALPNRVVVSTLFASLCLGIAKGFVQALSAELPRAAQSREAVALSLQVSALEGLQGATRGHPIEHDRNVYQRLQGQAAFVASTLRDAVGAVAHQLGSRPWFESGRVSLMYRDLLVAASHTYVSRDVIGRGVEPLPS